MQRKTTTVWIALLVLPIPLLILNSVVQSAYRATNPESDNVLINIFSILVGTAAVVMLLGIPIWIFRLIRAINHNTALDAQVKPEPQEPPKSPPQQ